MLTRVRAAGAGGQSVRPLAGAALLTEFFRVLLAEPKPEDRPLLIRLLQLMIDDHKQHFALADDFIVCVFLLAVQGRPEDCVLIWEARKANFSTFLGLNDVLLVGGGLDATLQHLHGLNAPDPQLLEHIDRAQALGRLDNPNERLAKIRAYCENCLNKRGAGS